MLHHKILNIRRAQSVFASLRRTRAFVLLVVVGATWCFLKAEQLCAGISSKEEIEVYTTLVEEVGMYQSSDYIECDGNLTMLGRESKTLQDEIELRSGFFNWVDYLAISEPPMLWWRHSFYWVDIWGMKTNFKVLYFDPYGVAPTAGYPRVDYRIKGDTSWTSLVLSYDSDADGGRIYAGEVTLSTGVWEYQYVAKNPTRVQEYRLELSSFVVSRPPQEFKNTGIANNQVVSSAKVVLSWGAVDPDLGDLLYYKVYFGTDTASMVVIYEGYATTCLEVMRLEPGKEYLWQVEATNIYGVTAKSVIWKFKTIEQIPDGKAFNYPNPFNPGQGATTIVFDMAKDGEAEISIFTEPGDLCWRRSFYGLLKGSNEITYDGRDDSGRVLYSGPYVVIIKKRYSLDGSESRDRCRLLVIK